MYFSVKIALMGTRGAPALYGGFETAVEEIGKRLVRRGYNVTVYCRNPGQKITEFEGMKLVNLPAIKHRMADALMLVEMLRSGLEKVTSGGADDLAVEAAVNKSWGSDSYIAMTAEAIQLHGGIGFTWEHNAHLYFRRARYDSAFLGDSVFQRERLATLLNW